MLARRGHLHIPSPSCHPAASPSVSTHQYPPRKGHLRCFWDSDPKPGRMGGARLPSQVTLPVSRQGICAALVSRHPVGTGGEDPLVRTGPETATVSLGALCPGAEGSLTGHPVNGPERSQHTDCSDSREADVLQVQRILQHPAGRGPEGGPLSLRPPGRQKRSVRNPAARALGRPGSSLSCTQGPKISVWAEATSQQGATPQRRRRPQKQSRRNQRRAGQSAAGRRPRPRVHSQGGSRCHRAEAQADTPTEGTDPTPLLSHPQPGPHPAMTMKKSSRFQVSPR